PDLDGFALQAFEEIERGVELDPYAERFGRNVGKILRRWRNAVVAGLVVQKFLLAEIGIVRRGHLGHGLADRDLAAELERTAGGLEGQIDGYRQIVTDALRRAGQAMA